MFQSFTKSYLIDDCCKSLFLQTFFFSLHLLPLFLWKPLGVVIKFNTLWHLLCSHLKAWTCWIANAVIRNICGLDLQMFDILPFYAQRRNLFHKLQMPYGTVFVHSKSRYPFLDAKWNWISLILYFVD